MDNKPDLTIDIDALFAHMVNNLNHNADDEKDWHFSLSSSDLSELERVAEELEEEFTVHIQEDVQEIEEDGSTTQGDPELTVLRRGALTADEVKQIATRLQQIASERGLTYGGVNCYDPIDEEELFGWLDPEDAGWRLRHMTDCGLADDADLPWAFLIDVPSHEAVKRISTALVDDGFSDRDEYDEPNEEGGFAICVFVQGRNNEIALYDCATKISKIAEQHDGELVGIQFYTREDVAAIFGVEDED